MDFVRKFFNDLMKDFLIEAVDMIIDFIGIDKFISIFLIIYIVSIIYMIITNYKLYKMGKVSIKEIVIKYKFFFGTWIIIFLMIFVMALFN